MVSKTVGQWVRGQLLQAIREHEPFLLLVVPPESTNISLLNDKVSILNNIDYR